MFQSIMSVIGAIKSLIDLWRWFLNWQAKERAKQAEIDRQERDKALEDLSNAKTEEEIWNAQERITRLKR